MGVPVLWKKGLTRGVGAVEQHGLRREGVLRQARRVRDGRLHDDVRPEGLAAPLRHGRLLESECCYRRGSCEASDRPSGYALEADIPRCAAARCTRGECCEPVDAVKRAIDTLALCYC